jgi:hypothetical protein
MHTQKKVHVRRNNIYKVVQYTVTLCNVKSLAGRGSGNTHIFKKVHSYMHLICVFRSHVGVTTLEDWSNVATNYKAKQVHVT